MPQGYQTFGPTSSSFTETIAIWRWALATTQISDQRARYAAVVSIVRESLDRFTTVQDLMKAYAAPDIGLRSRVLALCGDGAIRLQPQLVLGAACALRFHQVMEAAIA